MRSFKDTAGQQWNLDITVGSVRRVRDATGIMLPAIFDNDWQLFTELTRDVVKMVDVLWVLCERQAEESGVTPEAFAERLGGDSLGDAGEALVRATADFFTSQEQREALHNAIDKLKEMSSLIVMQAQGRLGAIDIQKLARNYLDSVTSTRESPASTRQNELLANSS